MDRLNHQKKCRISILFLFFNDGNTYGILEFYIFVEFQKIKKCKRNEDK